METLSTCSLQPSFENRRTAVLRKRRIGTLWHIIPRALNTFRMVAFFLKLGIGHSLAGSGARETSDGDRGVNRRSAQWDEVRGMRRKHPCQRGETWLRFFNSLA